MKKIRLEGIVAILCVLVATALPAVVLRGQNGGFSYDKLYIYCHESGKSIRQGLEEYTAHVTAALCEGFKDVPKGAAQAISIAARTQILLNKGTSCGHDYCTSGEHSLPYKADCPENVAEAVKETSGLVLSLGGALAPAFVHYSSYLVTQSAFNYTGREISCLVSVSSPENIEPCEHFVSFEEAEVIFEIKLGIETPDLSGELIITPDSTGRAKSVRILENIIGGSEFAAAFKLESANFKCEKREEGYLFRVYGSGDGLGMSLCGAVTMAEDKAGYGDILLHYYPGTEIVPVYTLLK